MYPECCSHVGVNQLGAHLSGLWYSSGVSGPSSGSLSGHIQNLYFGRDENWSSELRLVLSISTDVSALSKSGHGDSHPLYSGTSYCRSPPSRYRTAGSVGRGGSILCRVAAGALESRVVGTTCNSDIKIDGSSK